MEHGKRNSEWIIGVKVRIKTSLGEDLEGEIFSYDSTTNCLVLIKTSPHSTVKKSYRILKTTFVKEIHYLGKNEVNQQDFENLPPINIAKIKSNEAKALRLMREEASRIGVGVTEEAQEIFNALAKTLPCKWRGENILVFDEVTIKSPYTVDSTTGNDPTILDRVKKVLDGERKRLYANKV